MGVAPPSVALDWAKVLNALVVDWIALGGTHQRDGFGLSGRADRTD
jgi:hypothetical protein